jgi:multiple sugar transport system ATP-binding protein
MLGLEFKAVTKRYGDNPPVVCGLDLKVEPGEFMVLVGPSGCGKSTTLRMLAGLEDVSEGRIYIGERDVTHVAPAKRGVAMVFQSYALYPHMTVAENMGFGLKVSGMAKAEVDNVVLKAAQSLQLESLLARKPRELSGGQRQRVAIGRAIVRAPDVFLFDEPLSNLDAALRNQMRVELLRLHERLGTTIVYVTHDQVEAMTLGDRIAIFNQGRIEQVGPPLEVYRSPQNRFVAGFLGTPSINFLAGSARREPDGNASFEVPQSGKLALPALAEAAASQVHSVGVRPEHLQLAPPDGAWGLNGTLDVIEHLGDISIAYVKLPQHAETIAVKLGMEQGLALKQNQPLRLNCEREYLIAFDADGRSLLEPT